jgi:RNA polymerase sigma-70 factor (ECF subfamily)
MAEEIKQQMRCGLLVASPGQPPRITQYTGQGHLRHWVRVIALRDARRAMRKERRQPLAEDDQLLALATPAENPELAHLKRLYREEFKAAFTHALESLSSRERNMLRYRYFENLNIDQIGVLFHVHRATIARWLSREEHRSWGRSLAQGGGVSGAGAGSSF